MSEVNKKMSKKIKEKQEQTRQDKEVIHKLQSNFNNIKEEMLRLAQDTNAEMKLHDAEKS